MVPDAVIYFVSAITVVGLVLVSYTWRHVYLNHLAVKDNGDENLVSYARSKLMRSSIRLVVQASATFAYLAWALGRVYTESELVGLAITLMLITTTAGTSVLSIVEGQEMKRFLDGE